MNFAISDFSTVQTPVHRRVMMELAASYIRCMVCAVMNVAGCERCVLTAAPHSTAVPV